MSDRLGQLLRELDVDEGDGLTVDLGPLTEAALAGARMGARIAGVALSAVVLAGIVLDRRRLHR